MSEHKHVLETGLIITLEKEEGARPEHHRIPFNDLVEYDGTYEQFAEAWQNEKLPDLHLELILLNSEAGWIFYSHNTESDSDSPVAIPKITGWRDYVLQVPIPTNPGTNDYGRSYSYSMVEVVYGDIHRVVGEARLIKPQGPLPRINDLPLPPIEPIPLPQIPNRPLPSIGRIPPLSQIPDSTLTPVEPIPLPQIPNPPLPSIEPIEPLPQIPDLPLPPLEPIPFPPIDNPAPYSGEEAMVLLLDQSGDTDRFVLVSFNKSRIEGDTLYSGGGTIQGLAVRSTTPLYPPPPYPPYRPLYPVNHPRYNSQVVRFKSYPIYRGYDRFYY